jgi:hypothetical protein
VLSIINVNQSISPTIIENSPVILIWPIAEFHEITRQAAYIGKLQEARMKRLAAEAIELIRYRISRLQIRDRIAYRLP